MATKIIGQGTAAPIPQQQEGIPSLNAEQLRAVMQQIAHRATALRDLLINTNVANEALVAAVVNVAIHEMTSIGALADANADVPVLGDSNDWHFGWDFAVLGKEVRHG